MSDIRELLHDAAERTSELDLERVQRDGRRRQRRPLKIAGAIVAIVAVTAVATARIADDDQHSAPVIAPPPTEAPVTTTALPAPTTTPPTTTPPVTTLPLGEDRLSSESRFGYAGFGPIKLGMTLEEASTASGEHLVMVLPNECSANEAARVQGDPMDNLTGDGGFRGFGMQDGRIVNIWTTYRRSFTISGIQVGSTEDDVLRTYPNAVIGVGRHGIRMIRITNPAGHVVAFSVDAPGGTVRMIMTMLSIDVEDVGFC